MSTRINNKESTNKQAQYAVSFVAGLIFSLGLGISGMTLPEKVIGFLDVTGDWDGSLAFVMGGAVVVYAIAYRMVIKMERPRYAVKFHIPRRKDIDARLLVGAGLFGVGWGLGGFCPGPALVSLSAGFAGVWDIVIFVAFMMIGMWLFRIVDGILSKTP